MVFDIARGADGPNVELGEVSDDHNLGMGLTQVMLDAHRALMELNEENQEMFRDLVDLMQAEVDRER
jgi:hypothetical protein